ESFDRALRLLSSNPDTETVVSEWLLGEHTAYDLFKRAGRVTRVTDSEEVSKGINFLILIAPGTHNAKLTDQLDALKTLDQVVMLEKPIARSSLARSLAGFESPTICVPQRPTVSAFRDSGQRIERSTTSHRDLPDRSSPRAIEILDSLSQLLAEAQQKQHELVDLIRDTDAPAKRDLLAS
ncbi:MAG: hypothetical protein B7Z55_18685, partial [Planctomycetales bacterium 12-60-4]